MPEEFHVGDTVLCLPAEVSTCPYHTVEACGPDPNPEMAGQLYQIEAIGVPMYSECCGVIKVVGSDETWCSGCFEKVCMQ